jgi:hypothetical protein
VVDPTPDTLLTATAVAGTTRRSVWARAAAGLRLWRDLYVGPELTIYTTDTYRETKIGAHVTGLQLGILNFRVSGGIQNQDSAHNPSVYFALTSWIRL